MLDDVMWFTGVVTWVCFAIFGAALLADKVMDSIVTTFWTHAEFLAFVHDRLKKKRNR